MSANKFFIALILMSVTIFHATFAANGDIPIDWSKVKQVSSKQDLANYLEQSKRNGQTIIPVILANGLKISSEEFLKLAPSSLVDPKLISDDGQNIRMIYEITDYPGTRVANAYRSGDTSKLTQDEMKLYNVAVKIIDEAKKKSSWSQKEVYIYNEITRRATYYSENDMKHQSRFVTAIGALLDGKANCQGYSDAFYMLGRMLGWNVGRMSGTAGGEPHMWNTITFKSGKPDEKTYCVDVTWGDSKDSGEDFVHNSYIYFNAPIEIMQVTHSWDFSSAPKQIVGSIDKNYAYCIYANFGRANSAAAGIKLLAKKIAKENRTYAAVMVPYDEKYAEKNLADVMKNFRQEYVKLTSKKMTYHFRIRRHGKYLFFRVHVY